VQDAYEKALKKTLEPLTARKLGRPEPRPSPPANLYEFEWQGQTYQVWVRVYGSDAELVKMVRKLVDEPLREPLPAEASLPEKWPGARSSLEALAPETANVLVAVASQKPEIQSRQAAHLCTQRTSSKGEVVEGGGYIFFAQWRWRSATSPGTG